MTERRAAPGAARDARLRFRRNEPAGPTAAMAPGYVQGNLVVLPGDVADEFLRFCRGNPKPCPVLGVSEPGAPHLPALGEDLDVRTDLARYRIWRDGEVAGEADDVTRFWRDDLVSIVLGCSFSFDHVLMEEGIPVRYIEENTPAPAYVTDIETVPAGRFHGPLVVAMRPLRGEHAIRAIQISSRFPAAHGAPVHIGAPELIGIRDLDRPEFGRPVPLRHGELPVFWACGATPQSVVAASKVSFCITHAATATLITDLRVSELATFQPGME